MSVSSPEPATSGERPCRIFVINGIRPWRAAITLVINKAPGLKVCGTAADEDTALKRIARLRPCLVLTEILNPQGLGLIHELHRRHTHLPVLVLSFRSEEIYALPALAAGACGYLMKGMPGAQVVAGIRRALAGEQVLSPALSHNGATITGDRGATQHLA